jgi:hypothetical protein
MKEDSDGRQVNPWPARRQFLLGIAAGAAPLVVAEIGTAGMLSPGLDSEMANAYLSVLGLGLVVYFGGWIFALATAANPEHRRFSFGMMVALGASLLIYPISCQVIPRLSA